MRSNEAIRFSSSSSYRKRTLAEEKARLLSRVERNMQSMDKTIRDFNSLRFTKSMKSSVDGEKRWKDPHCKKDYGPKIYYVEENKDYLVTKNVIERCQWMIKERGLTPCLEGLEWRKQKLHRLLRKERKEKQKLEEAEESEE